MDVLGVGQVLVHLAHVLGLVVHQEGARAVEQRQVQAVEHVANLLEAAHGGVAVDLAVDESAVGVDLAAVGGDEVHDVAHGLEELAERVIAELAAKWMPCSRSLRMRS